MTVLRPAAGHGDPPAVRVAEPALRFDARAARLRALAEGHAAAEWLSLLAQIARGQAAAVREVRPAAAPPAAPDGPPLAWDRIPRDGAWRRMLAVLLSHVRTGEMPAETQEAVRRLSESDEAQLEALAGAFLAGAVPSDRAACAPFVGAALQAWFAALAARIDPGGLGPTHGACAVCGGPPVAGVVQGDDRRRYVSCALCTAEWNVPRVHCVSCDTATAPEYFQIEGQQGAKAEACPACRSYVKLFDALDRPGAEPAADDAATIALDLMLAEDGWLRAGANVYVGAG